MDNLQSLMRCLDDISNLIPEGTYLEMCDNLNQVHKNLPKNDDPPMRDNRRVPFQVVLPGEVAVYRIVNDEWTQNEERLQRLMVDLQIAKRRLRNLRYINNITKKIREDAIRDLCVGDIERVGGGSWTFENLNANTVWNSEYEREECTSKVYERTLYNNYKTRTNNQRHEAMELERNLEREISDLRDRQSYLGFRYNRT